jgi:flagellar basal body-associated protein FliL
MSDEIRVQRPQTAPAMQQPMYQEPTSKSSSKSWIILGVVVVVLIVVGVLFRDKLFGAKSSKVKGTVTSMANSGYQAIFLTNGQVYFGKITKMDSDYLTASDIYYLQVVQPPLQGSGQDAAAAQAQAAAQPQISLVKLGNELHGPEDEMHISRAQVLFYENLKEDGSVVKAIRSYQQNPSGTPAPAK